MLVILIIEANLSDRYIFTYYDVHFATAFAEGICEPLRMFVPSHFPIRGTMRKNKGIISPVKDHLPVIGAHGSERDSGSRQVQAMSSAEKTCPRGTSLTSSRETRRSTSFGANPLPGRRNAMS